MREFQVRDSTLFVIMVTIHIMIQLQVNAISYGSWNLQQLWIDEAGMKKMRISQINQGMVFTEIAQTLTDNILKEQVRSSDTIITAAALSNSPQ